MDLKTFLESVPTNSVGNNGYTSAAPAAGPCAGFDKYLFPKSEDDLLSQDFQTPAETGLAKWTYGSGVYPVMKVSLRSNLGDGPSIDSMVSASDEYTNLMNRRVEDTMKKTFSRFMEEASPAGKKCPPGEYYCTKRKKCMPIPKGYHVGRGGWLVHDHKNGKNGNGNGNGSHNGNGNGNGNGSNGNGGHGNGNGGNGGGNGGE